MPTFIKIDPPFIAHRGASSLAPENTLAAFLKAYESGAKWVELDVMLTQDHEVVVIHDETLNRTTNGKGRVIDYPYQYLKTLDAGSWFDEKFSGEIIPKLSDVLALLNNLNLSVNIEIKAQKGNEELTVKKVQEIVATYAQDMQILFTSFSVPTLELIRKFLPNGKIGFLMHKWQKNWNSICDKLQCVTVNVEHNQLTAQRVQEIKVTKRLVLAYTVNDAKRAKELFAWGVDAIFTDNLLIC